jgi:hypothetical protein
MTPAASSFTKRSRTVLLASSTLAAMVFKGMRALVRNSETMCWSIASILFSTAGRARPPSIGRCVAASMTP